jgi:hypothetical protein
MYKNAFGKNLGTGRQQKRVDAVKNSNLSMLNSDLAEIKEFHNNTYLAYNTVAKGSPNGRDALDKFLNEMPTSV